MWKLSLAVERSFSSQRCQDFFLSWIRIHALQVLQNTGIAKLALYLPIDPIMDTNTCPAYKSTTHITGSVQSCLGLPLVPAADPKLGENYRRKRSHCWEKLTWSCSVACQPPPGLGPDLRSVQARKYWTESHAQRSRGTKSSAGGRETAPRRPLPVQAVRFESGARRQTGCRRHWRQQRLRNAADGQGAELQNSGACARSALRAKASARKMPSRCSTRWRKMPSRSEGYGVSKTGKMQGNCESSRLGRCKAHVCAAF